MRVDGPTEQSRPSLHRGFQNADRSPESDATFRWLDRADAHPMIRGVKEGMLELCPVAGGDDVLDVGCGLGHEVGRLAERVGPAGRVVGVDFSPAMVAEARRRAAARSAAVAFEVGDAQRLEFADGTFDLARTERVLRYLQSPEQALREMQRVVRADGSLVAFDFDTDMTIVDAPDLSLTRRVAEVLDAAVPSPWIGRQLFALFRKIGLVDVRVVPHPIVLTGDGGFALYQQLNRGTIQRAVQAGRITAGDAAAWWSGLGDAARTDTFFTVNLGFIVAGRKTNGAPA
jgi:ubiquinone/menaquinone biosynthesis C-methylase UbiE